MFQMKGRLFLKSELSDLKDLVFYHTAVLLFLTHSCGGQPHLVGPTQPIVAMPGEDITLPCSLEPVADASAMTVEWARPDLDPRFVYLMRDRVELESEENVLYRSRTSLSTDKLKCGDISLKLSKVRFSDAGTYKCLIPNLKTESAVEFAVGSFSSPDITISIVTNGVMLECKSVRWYPQPKVFWLDSDGNLLSAEPTKAVKGPDGLYTVSSRVTVEKRHSNSFTCRVQQNNINQTREAHVNVPDDFFLVQASSAVRITICVAVCFTSVAAVVVVMWKCGKKHEPEQQKESQDLQQHHVKIAELDDALKRKEEDVKHVQDMITTLKAQKDNLKNQTKTLNSQLQEVKTKLVEMKNKLKEGALIDEKKKSGKREAAIADLGKRQKELEGLLESTDKLTESTEGMINRMTERKGKLENDKEQIIKQLKEAETQREKYRKKSGRKTKPGNDVEQTEKLLEEVVTQKEDNQREFQSEPDKVDDTGKTESQRKPGSDLEQIEKLLEEAVMLREHIQGEFQSVLDKAEETVLDFGKQKELGEKMNYSISDK